MTPIRARRVLSVSCVSALAALALMSWQLFDPYVVPVIIAMSLGQILGTASFAAYLVVVDDLRTQRRAGQKSDKVTGAEASQVAPKEACPDWMAAAGPISLKKYGEPDVSTIAPCSAQPGCTWGAAPGTIIGEGTYVPATRTRVTCSPRIVRSSRVSAPALSNCESQR